MGFFGTDWWFVTTATAQLILAWGSFRDTYNGAFIQFLLLLASAKR